MKKIFVALLFMTGLTMGLSAQEKDRVRDKDVPETIQSSFKTEFPEARDAEWMLKDGHYKVKFEVNDVNQIAAFDAEGKLISKGIEIKQTELPAAVSSAVQSGYAGKDIDKAYKVEKDGNIQYLVKLKGTPETKILYSADGQVVKEK